MCTLFSCNSTISLCLLVIYWIHSTTAQTTAPSDATESATQETDNDGSQDFWTAFFTFAIGGIPVIITLSVFLCIGCVTINCSLWWYFKHIEHENRMLLKEKQEREHEMQLHSQNNSNSSHHALMAGTDPTEHRLSDNEYYAQNGTIILPVVHEHESNHQRKQDEQDDDAHDVELAQASPVVIIDDEEQKYYPHTHEADEQQIEGSGDDDDDVNHSSNDTQRRRQHYPKSKSLQTPLTGNKSSRSQQSATMELALSIKLVGLIRDNIQQTYNSRAKIPDLSHARRDECTVNDLWKEIDKLKAIVYWYDSAMKGHLSFCDEQFNSIASVSQKRRHRLYTQQTSMRRENVNPLSSGSLHRLQSIKRLKLSDDLSTMSLPERNMYIIDAHRNDQEALRQETYLNLMAKIASLNDVMQEEEKMCKPNYENYEEFECDICNQRKTNLNDILIFDECYHFYCLDCLKYILLKRNTSQKTKCPFNGCNHILTKYEIQYIKKHIHEQKKEQQRVLSTSTQAKSPQSQEKQLLADPQNTYTNAIITRVVLNDDGDDEEDEEEEEDIRLSIERRQRQSSQFQHNNKENDEKVLDLEYYDSDKPKLYRGFSVRSGSSARSFGKLYSQKFRESVSLGYAELLNKITSSKWDHNASNQTKTTVTNATDKIGEHIHNLILLEAKEDTDGVDDEDDEETIAMNQASATYVSRMNEKLKIIKFLASNYCGQNELFEGAFGIRPVVYCDWISSAKPLKSVEKYLSLEVMTLYSANRNGGSMSSTITRAQTNQYILEAKSIILRSIGGDIRRDSVIFCGNGASDAIYKLSNVLLSPATNKKYCKYMGSKTIVFVSIYECDSNVFVWKELGCQVIVVPEDKDEGIGINQHILEEHLKIYSSHTMRTKYNLLIGSFTAASNVSGVQMKHNRITALLHKYGALSFWDFSTGGPYMDVNMDDKDAVFLSTHRFIGGPQSMGILCAKTQLFENFVPTQPQNNTLFYAYGSQDGQYEYLDNIEEREEANTLNIIGAVRSAICFYIKDAVSAEFIQMKHTYNLNYFMTHCAKIKNLKIIGYTRNKSLENRLPIISFEIKYKNKFLHYNFVASLMNDLFGIQGNGGNANCGMYCKYSLNLTDDEMEHMIQQISRKKNELSRPGYYSLYLHFTLTQQELKYICKAVKYICSNGWKFLPLYNIDVECGNFFHRSSMLKPTTLRSLLDIHIDRKTGKLLWKDNHERFKANELQRNLDQYFIFADEQLKNLKKTLPTKQEISLDKKVRDKHSWYWLPAEMFPYVVEHAFHDIIKVNKARKRPQSEQLHYTHEQLQFIE